MSRSTQYRTSAAEYDGKLPYVVSGGATVSNGTQNIIRFTAPCDGYVEAFNVTVNTLASHANAAIAFGSLADPDSHLDDYDLTNIAAGAYDLVSDALMLNRNITKGTTYVVQLTSGDTTGVIDASIVINAR